jgi:DNA-binding MarR family transcriptional regulator
MMMVRLTDKGRAVQQNFIRQTEALTEEIAGVLGRAEAETMLRALIKLADYFRA